jgi:hypothetical protein
MEHIADIYSRRICFQDFDPTLNLSAEFPDKEWCLVLLADEEESAAFDAIIEAAIERNVGYIHSVGRQHDAIHNLADSEIVRRDIHNLFLPKHIVMTTGDEDFERGIWAGIYTTYQGETEIYDVVILDHTRQARAKTVDLVQRFAAGYELED